METFVEEDGSRSPSVTLPVSNVNDGSKLVSLPEHGVSVKMSKVTETTYSRTVTKTTFTSSTSRASKNAFDPVSVDLDTRSKGKDVVKGLTIRSFPVISPQPQVSDDFENNEEGGVTGKKNPDSRQKKQSKKPFSYLFCSVVVVVIFVIVVGISFGLRLVGDSSSEVQLKSTMTLSYKAYNTILSASNITDIRCSFSNATKVPLSQIVLDLWIDGTNQTYKVSPIKYHPLIH
jgi:hypothetical protein